MCVFFISFFSLFVVAVVLLLLLLLFCVCAGRGYSFFLFSFFLGGDGLGKGVYNYHFISQLMFWALYPFMPNGIPHCYQLDQTISILRVVGW